MARVTFTIAAVAVFCSAAVATPPPSDASAIQAVRPSDVFSWPGPGVRVTWQSERTRRENKWFALTGRVVAVQVEAELDL
jgi:hypothetical protein